MDAYSKTAFSMHVVGQMYRPWPDNMFNGFHRLPKPFQTVTVCNGFVFLGQQPFFEAPTNSYRFADVGKTIGHLTGSFSLENDVQEVVPFRIAQQVLEVSGKS